MVIIIGELIWSGVYPVPEEYLMLIITGDTIPDNLPGVYLGATVIVIVFSELSWSGISVFPEEYIIAITVIAKPDNLPGVYLGGIISVIIIGELDDGILSSGKRGLRHKA